MAKRIYYGTAFALAFVAGCAPAEMTCERTEGFTKEGLPIIIGEPCVTEPRRAPIPAYHDDDRSPPVVHPPAPPVVHPPAPPEDEDDEVGTIEYSCEYEGYDDDDEDDDEEEEEDDDEDDDEDDEDEDDEDH